MTRHRTTTRTWAARPWRTHAATASALFAILALWSCGGTDTTAPENPNPTPTNNAPVASAGTDQSVSATLPVGMDGSASTDADGDAISYAWSLTTIPAGSAAAFADATAASPSFTPDVAGDYVVQLIVSDGTDDSAPDEVTVTAQDNTSSATIDGGGGSLMSTDGAVALTIPAGALPSGEEISMTLVAASQTPDELANFGDDKVIYDLGPDGQSFDVPIRITMAPGGVYSPTVDGDEVTVPLMTLATLSDGTIELPENHLMTVDLDAMTVEVSGDIEHFSSVVTTHTDEDGDTKVRLVSPRTAVVGEPFDVTIEARHTDDLGGGTSVETVSLEQIADFPAAVHSFDAESNTNQFVCEAAGTGQLELTLVTWLIPLPAGMPTHMRNNPLRSTYHLSVLCVAPFTAFEIFSLVEPEGISTVGPAQPAPAGESGVPSALAFAHEGGARLTDNAGGAMADFSAPALAMNSVFQAAGNPDDGLVVASSEGLFEFAGMLPATASEKPPQEVLTAMAEPVSGPTLASHATDVVAFGEPGSRGLAAVLFADQDIAIFESGTDEGGGAGFHFRDDLDDVFKPAGVSIFGTDKPISAYVQPEGFTESYPMLVLTVTDDADERGKIWTVALDGGSATATEVDNLFPARGARRIRCLENVCATSAFGSGIANGNVLQFTWDGMSTFSPISGFGGGRSVGIDLRRVGPDRVRIAETSFLNGTFSVTEVTTAGEFQGHVFQDVPESCTGPGHIAFRQDHEVIITCNTSGNVISAEFTLTEANWDQVTGTEVLAATGAALGAPAGHPRWGGWPVARLSRADYPPAPAYPVNSTYPRPDTVTPPSPLPDTRTEPSQ